MKDFLKMLIEILYLLEQQINYQHHYLAIIHDLGFDGEKL